MACLETSVEGRKAKQDKDTVMSKIKAPIDPDAIIGDSLIVLRIHRPIARARNMCDLVVESVIIHPKIASVFDAQFRTEDVLDRNGYNTMNEIFEGYLQPYLLTFSLTFSTRADLCHTKSYGKKQVDVGYHEVVRTQEIEARKGMAIPGCFLLLFSVFVLDP